MSNIPTVYIGYDNKEHQAYEVLRESILDTASEPISVVALDQSTLRRINFFRRSFKLENSVRLDTQDNKPFSTEFSFTRFLVPFVNNLKGLALFMDCDMMVRSDIIEVFDYASREDKAIWCVKHNYNPTAKTKMDDQVQTQYNRKNWSSFVLWNCEHEAHQNLTVDDVNLKTGYYLHNFQWLSNDLIGDIPEEWNWLDGHSHHEIEAKNVHFTTGGPWFPGWKPQRLIDAKYALEWTNFRDAIEIDEVIGKTKTIKWNKTYE
jgi:hypothetical protein